MNWFRCLAQRVDIGPSDCLWPMDGVCNCNLPLAFELLLDILDDRLESRVPGHLRPKFLFHLSRENPQNQDSQGIRVGLQVESVLLQVFLPRGKVFQQLALVVASGEACEVLEPFDTDNF